MTLSEEQKKQCEEHDWDFSDLSATFVNCTLKKSPRTSHTRGLMDVSKAILEENEVDVDVIRPVDHDIAFGVYPDMTDEGWDSDDWPEIFERIFEADILVLGTPIWLGERSSVCSQIIERLYAMSGEHNDKGQYLYYGKTAGVIVTGNEDGIKHCAMNTLYALQHIGYSVPPQADAGWIGEAGPGPSYLDEDSGGPENDFTQRNTTFMTWNLMHSARRLKDNDGIPAHGNVPEEWDAGCRYDHPNPEHR
jgi:multimeric flavodoxin WrbA